jgi:hypothetical protein
VYGARSPSAQVSKKRVTRVNVRGSVVPDRKFKCEEVCGEAEQPVDPVGGAEVFQNDPPRVNESAESGSSSTENVLGWVDDASHDHTQSRQESEVPATSQTKPYADPCKDGEEKAEGDHRRPLALIKLSSVSRRRQDRIRRRSKKYRNHTCEGASQRSTMFGVSVSVSNVSARALVDCGCGGGLLISRTFADRSGIDNESSSGERFELPDGTLHPMWRTKKLLSLNAWPMSKRCESGGDRVECIRSNSWAAKVSSMES